MPLLLLECLTSPSKRSTIPGALQTSPEDSPLQDTNMKLMKTQGASDAMQMTHYKLTIIIIIRNEHMEVIVDGFSRLLLTPALC